MKRIHILVLLLACSVAVWARPVGLPRAQQLVEEHFFAPAVCVSPADWDELYVFASLNGAGFVIVSADDCTRPVLGYSMSARWPVASGQLPEHVAAWIDGYRQEIASLRKAGAIPSAAVQDLWQQPKRSHELPVVEPLMTTTWNQSPWYNAMCPYSASDSARAVTGCVATATAQVMKYWNHPAMGHGRHFYLSDNFGGLAVDFDTLYQWDSMPDALGWGSSETEIHAVAQLMYHVGVAVEMNYGVHSSGAYVSAYGAYNLPSSERALREHFRYSPMLYSVWKSSYSDTEWDSIIRNEIVHGRPVLYSGHDASGGHAFVLDGCDSLGMFHVNWGWGGWCDGYYTTDSLSPAPGGIGGNSTYTFNQNNCAIVDIRPSYGNDTVAVVSVVSADTAMGTVSGSGVYTPYEDTLFVKASGLPGYRFAGWKSGNTANPLNFVVNGDFTDTALFVPTGRDTLAYCDNHYHTAWRDDFGTVTEWGIRVPADMRNDYRSLSAVQLYVVAPGYYTMSVYYGDEISPANLIHYQQFDLTGAYGWSTVEPDSALVLLGDKPLWITFRFSHGTTFPAASSYYTGVSDGTWYRLPGGWVPFDEEGIYLSWMIRALFNERPCRVAIENAGYCDLDAFHGAGDYPLGSTVTVSVSDPFFTWWEGIGVTDSAITFTVTGDTTFYAYCHEVGIDDVEEVETPETVVGIYDIMGRRVGTRREELRLLPAGVYLLRMDIGTVKKTVIL